MNNIVNYWYELEYFKPSCPIDIKKDIIDEKNEIYPWHNLVHKENCQVSFDIYIGSAPVDKIVKWLKNKLDLSEEFFSQSNAYGVLCALKVDEDGYYITDSFTISSFFWAVCELANSNLSQNLDINSFELFLNNTKFDINCEINKSENKISFDLLKSIFNKVRNNLELEKDILNMSFYSKKHIQKGKKIEETDEYEFPKINPNTEIFSSYYLKDLQIIKELNQNTKLERYINSLFENNTKVEINKDIDELNKILSIEKYPLGMWPAKSEYHPCLMQQVAINCSISDEQQIFSVNGPPGTGKTTLLKEIIASNIVKRAILLSEYSEPKDAFTQKQFTSPIDEFNRTYYEIDKNLINYGTIVVSNNNKAVENISIELPKSIQLDRTGHFNADENNDIYFTTFAKKLFDNNVWGLISAKLGNQGNIKHFKKIFGDALNSNYYIENELCNWEKAKEDFQNALDNVCEHKRQILKIQEILLKQNELKKEINTFEREYQEFLNQSGELSKKLKDMYARKKYLQKQIDKTDENIKLITKKLSPLKRKFYKLFPKNPFIAKWIEYKNKIENLYVEIFELNDNISALEDEADVFQIKTNKHYEYIEEHKSLLKQITDEINKFNEKFDSLVPNKIFWNNIEKNEFSQECTPWTNSYYDALREELFYQALNLHKAFILNNNAVKQNLKRLLCVWDNKIINENSAYKHLINTLLLLTPVISTTFASVQTFLSNINENELGTVIIDEAGQAAPQSALGIIWRAQKTIVVGDPFQIEPINTVPYELQKIISDKYQIDEKYRIQELSVQILADNQNKYGGYRTLNDERFWLGCPLVLHRRCLDPMFSISNKIAYNNSMILKTENIEFKPLILNSSCWIDIKGRMSEKGDQNIKEQNDFVLTLFKDAVSKVNNISELDLYIITPFKKICEELSKGIEKILKERFEEITHSSDNTTINDYIEEHCGTIHTFQGKEANEVILVLGCDNELGSGAANWVGKKPNIINVAITRAKHQVYIVGDYEQWVKIPHVKVACEMLPRKTPDKFIKE